MKGMNEYLDVEAESSDGGDDSDNNDDGDDIAGVRDIPTATCDDDALIRSPCPKHHWTTRGKLAQKNKEIVEQTLSTMIISEEAMVQFAINLLVSMLLTVPAQKNVLAQSSSTISALDVAALNSPKRTVELPPTSGTKALLETITAPPSSPTTRLVSTGKIRFIFLFHFSYTFHGV